MRPLRCHPRCRPEQDLRLAGSRTFEWLLQVPTSTVRSWPVTDILRAVHEFTARLQRGTKPSARCAGTQTRQIRNLHLENLENPLSYAGTLDGATTLM